MKIDELIKSDNYRYTKSNSRLSLLKCYRKYPTLYYLHIYRKAHFYSKRKGLFNKSLMWLYRFILHREMIRLQIQIPYTNIIGAGFCIQHVGRVVVAPNVCIGKNCDVFTGVTIGKEFRGARNGVPTIGNEVWIGPNAVLVGKITIGNDVLIAPNSYVNFDVPSHSIVLGNPAKIITKKNATEEYIKYKYL